MASSPRRAPDLRIGISGWRYPPWRGTFYPEGLPQHRELEYASRQVNTVEINGSFYSLQRPESYAQWRDAVPEDFVFAVKGGRFITHMKRLRGGVPPLANFFASGVLALERKLGPFLWQLPPMLTFREDVLDEFLSLLPRTMSAAAGLAARHDRRLKGRAYLQVDAERPLRHALEVRHESFRDPAFVRLLRKHRVALCVADSAGEWPLVEDVTADFLYVRLHGRTRLYASGYSAPALDRWAQRIRLWSRGREPRDADRIAPRLRAPAARARDVYVYFDNDAKIRAPYDAINLAARLGGGERIAFPRRARSRGEEPRPPGSWDAWRGYGRRAALRTRRSAAARK
ncbi:MAG TPA: DUF72 domain-containing protein [Candidatus Binatia bacterium]|nr:DUF72 domain-containing protein [Candidatus Binatia bacterium]